MIGRARINGLLDSIENPIAMLNEYIREMEQELQKGEPVLAHQIYLEKKQNALIGETESLIARRKAQARLAVKQGEDFIAKLALQEKLIHQEQLNLYTGQLAILQYQTQTLYEQLDELKRLYHELQHKRLLLISKANTAQSIKQMQKTIVAFHSETIANGVSRAEDRIFMIEAEAQASKQFMANPYTAVKGYIDPGLEHELEQVLQVVKKEAKPIEDAR
ncbi:PspA/IM30 family protein [Domibacillus robiginosus]|uniref:PspA/IM30 family protein n=1 Tax=Domibacillus robiginosus TaxID=1071054 RepID=UPI001FDEEA36|nr:PspA/IM30 family protein [Domibacillus robiginosus]